MACPPMLQYNYYRSSSNLPVINHITLPVVIRRYPGDEEVRYNKVLLRHATLTRTMSQYAHYSEMSPELAAAFAKLPPIKLIGDIQSVRDASKAMFRGTQTANALKAILPPGREIAKLLLSGRCLMAFSDSTYSVHDYKVPVDGGEILVRGVIPSPTEGEDRTFPLLVWYHGGGAPIGECFSHQFTFNLNYPQDLPLAIFIRMIRFFEPSV